MLDLDLASWQRDTSGYPVWAEPVLLEPPFSSLLTPTPALPLDDGRRPGVLAQLFGKQKKAPPAEPSAPLEGPRPLPAGAQADLVELQLVLPQGFELKPSYARSLIAAFHNTMWTLSLEFIGLAEGVVIQLCCGKEDEGEVRRSLQAFFPETKIRNHQRFLQDRWSEETRWATMIDFGLSEPAFHTLKSTLEPQTDPLIGLVGALSVAEDGELLLLQIMFESAIAPWGDDLRTALELLPELSAARPLVEEKFGEPLHAAVVRVAALSRESRSSFEQARSVGNALIAATRGKVNSLVPLNNDGYPDELHEAAFLSRQSYRSGMLLSASELVCLAHLPSASVRSERLLRQSEKTRPAPLLAQNGEILLGLNEHEGESVEVRLSSSQRLRHTYLIGASGTGKSTLLLSMILQDIESGRGLALLDPHGDLVDDVLSRLPSERAGDVIVFDPADEEFPVGFNALTARSDVERALLVSDFVNVMRRLSTSWGDQMTSVLGNAVAAILYRPGGGTLLDLRRLLTDPAFRKEVVSTVPDEEIAYFWNYSYPLLKGHPEAPLLTRLDNFLRPKSLRYVVSQQGEKLDFRGLMDQGKIFLARLSQGAISEENSFLLGSLLMARLALAASSRQDTAISSRRPFYIYVDEFHNFITPSLAGMLSGVRKYGVGLVLAHQDLRQLKSRSEDVLSSILANACTRIAFRVSEADAKILAEGLSHFEPPDLQNLPVGHAIARVERGDLAFNLRSLEASRLDPAEADFRRQEVLERSRASFGTPRAEVEEILRRAYPASTESSSQAKSRKPAAAAPKEEVEQTEGVEAPPAPVIPSKLAKRSEGPPLPGRGGPQHKYLQALVKRVAEDHGFHVTLEKRVLDGAGHVDVAIESALCKIAVEISVTTDTTNELKNLSKCLAAGFDYAVLVSSDRRILREARDAMTAESSDDRLRYLTPDAIVSFLAEIRAEMASSSKTIRGYKIKVKKRALSPEEQSAKQKLLADVIAKSFKRQK